MCFKNNKQQKTKNTYDLINKKYHNIVIFKGFLQYNYYDLK